MLALAEKSSGIAAGQRFLGCAGSIDRLDCIADHRLSSRVLISREFEAICFERHARKLTATSQTGDLRPALVG
jgi:hypothetical protein